jgi:hypothetical protein
MLATTARLWFGEVRGRCVRGTGEAKRRPDDEASGEWRLGFRAGRLASYTVLGLPSLAGLPCFWTGPRIGLVRGIFMPCWLGPCADVAAQAD